MFKTVKFPLLSDKITNPLNEEKNSLEGLTWNELASKGYLKESIEVNDDVVTMTKDFISTDSTLKRSEKIIIPKENFDDYIKKDFDEKELEKEISNLEEELKAFKEIGEYEICATIRDQILFLKDFIKSTLINAYK